MPWRDIFGTQASMRACHTGATFPNSARLRLRLWKVGNSAIVADRSACRSLPVESRQPEVFLQKIGEQCLTYRHGNLHAARYDTGCVFLDPAFGLCPYLLAVLT